MTTNDQTSTLQVDIEVLPDPPRALDFMQQAPHIEDAKYTLQHHFRQRADILVESGDYLCQKLSIGLAGSVVPDCLVAFNVDVEAIIALNGYVIDAVGKPPDFALEVASKTTGRRDYIAKREIYAGFGVSEYWRFDRTGGEYHDAALAGDILVDGRYEAVEVEEYEDGSYRGYSVVLKLYLCWEEGRLRFYNPVTRRYLPTLEERVIAAEERAMTAEQRAMDAEDETERLREQLRRLQSEE